MIRVILYWWHGISTRRECIRIYTLTKDTVHVDVVVILGTMYNAFQISDSLYFAKYAYYVDYRKRPRLQGVLMLTQAIICTAKESRSFNPSSAGCSHVTSARRTPKKSCINKTRVTTLGN